MGFKSGGGMGLDGNTTPVTGGWRAPACSETSVRGRWLGDLDSNQDCTGQSREFYR